MFFNEVLEGNPDPVFGLTGAFKADPRAHKVDLIVGIYKDADLKAELLSSVKEAKKRLLSSDLPADYLPFEGISTFYTSLGELLFGKKSWDVLDSRTYATQALGGTGALRLGAEFLFSEVTKTIFIPHPTWANHRQVFEKVGMRVETYPYYDWETKTFDCEAMCKKLLDLPPKTAVVLHATCHNPSGRDPMLKQWQQIFQIMKERQLVPFFDCAYQGFGKGLETDAAAVREWLQFGQEMLVAYSCSKNFSLYNERVGALYILTENSAAKRKVGSQLKRVVRALYSNPPSSGARIVSEILNTPELIKRWKEDVDAMRQRITITRQNFIELLKERSKTIDFSYLSGHLGLFMFLDLSKIQCERLIKEFGVYLLDTGRVSVAGMNEKNMDYVVNAIIKVSNS